MAGPALISNPTFWTGSKEQEQQRDIALVILAGAVAARAAPAVAAPVARITLGLELSETGILVGANPFALFNLAPQPFGFVPAKTYGLEPNYYLPRGIGTNLPDLIPGAKEQRAAANTGPAPNGGPVRVPDPFAGTGVGEQDRLKILLFFSNATIAQIRVVREQIDAGQNPLGFQNPARGAQAFGVAANSAIATYYTNEEVLRQQGIRQNFQTITTGFNILVGVASAQTPGERSPSEQPVGQQTNQSVLPGASGVGVGGQSTSQSAVPATPPAPIIQPSGPSTGGSVGVIPPGIAAGGTLPPSTSSSSGLPRPPQPGEPPPIIGGGVIPHLKPVAN